MQFNVPLMKAGESNKTVEIDAVDSPAAIVKAEDENPGWHAAGRPTAAFSPFYVTLQREGEYSRITVQARDTGHAKAIAEAGWAGSEMIACSVG